MGSKGGVVSIVGALILLQRNASRREACLSSLLLCKSLLTREPLLPSSPGDMSRSLSYSCAIGLEIGAGVRGRGWIGYGLRVR